MDIWDYLSLLSYGLLLASSFVSLVLIILGRDYRNSQESFWLENRPIDDWRSVTLAVPAYNEEKVIIQCLESIAKVEYQGLKVVVVDDGSRDQTAELVRNFIDQHRLSPNPYKLEFYLLNQANQGKGAALNSVIFDYTDSEIVGCLDADSEIDPRAVTNAVRHFNLDNSIIAVSSYIDVIKKPSLFYWLQKIEYLIAFGLKKGITRANMDYLLPGPGSFFVRDSIIKIGGYDHDTITEDLGLSLKIVDSDLENKKLYFASDVITRTDPVSSWQDLYRQRKRWIRGWFQNLLRYRNLLLSTSKRHSWQLTVFYLPYLVISQFFGVFQISILFVTIMISLIVGNPWVLVLQIISIQALQALIFYFIFTDANILPSKERWKLSLGSFSVIGMLMGLNLLQAGITIGEYGRLLWSIVRPDVKDSGSWQHVSRS